AIVPWPRFSATSSGKKPRKAAASVCQVDVLNTTASTELKVSAVAFRFETNCHEPGVASLAICAHSRALNRLDWSGVCTTNPSLLRAALFIPSVSQRKAFAQTSAAPVLRDWAASAAIRASTICPCRNSGELALVHASGGHAFCVGSMEMNGLISAG